MDIVTLLMARKYTDDTADGMGAVKGAPCTVSSISDITGGKRITLSWKSNSGTVQTQNFDIMNGADGTDGLSVIGAELNADNSITFTMSDGTKYTTDPIPTVKGDTGDKGEDGEDGFSPEITVKESSETRYVLHVKTADDEFDTPNLKGDGSGSASAIADLKDVAISSVKDGQVLRYSAVLGKWVNSDGAEIDSLSDIADVDLSEIADGQVIVWNAAERKWKNADVANPLQFDTIPEAADYPQRLIQFTGSDTADYKRGYFYRSTPKVDGGILTYEWIQADVQPSNRNYDDLDNLPRINGVTLTGEKTSGDFGLQGQVQFNTLPTAGNTYAGVILQYTGTTTADYKNGYFYQCRYDADTASYKWVQCDVSSNTGLEGDVSELKRNQGDMSSLEIGGVSTLVSALNALNSKELQSITYSEPNIVVTWKNGATYSFDITAILNDTEIGELSDVIDTTIADGNILQYDGSILKYKPYDILSKLSDLLAEAKAYTDEEIQSSIQVAAIVCDEKPSYDAVNDTVVYKQNGEIKTTTHTDTRFYYEDGQGDPYCTSWIDDIEFTYSVSDSKFSDYVNKNTDVTSDYTEDSADKTKIPNVSAIDALLAIVKEKLSGKVNTADVIDAITSQDGSKVLSAKQGYVLAEMIAAKNDRFQYSSMPTAGAAIAGVVVQYVGTSSNAYKKGVFYACTYNSGNDEWYWNPVGYTKDEIDARLANTIELVSNE